MSLVNVAIHSSQFPEKVRQDLLESLRARAVNHKFHYDSVKQTQKWLALHQAHSPSRNDADCAATYDRAFAAAIARIDSKDIHLIGLGCGGGQKDTRLLRLLQGGEASTSSLGGMESTRAVPPESATKVPPLPGGEGWGEGERKQTSARRQIFYTPCDVSAAMVLTAHQTALSVLPEDRCFPLVCDLAGADDLPAIFPTRNTKHATRITSFFGMIPNFEPDQILPKLATLVGKNDFLLFSANLAPGKDYDAGVRKILPQYDNPLTRDWLSAFLFDLGVEPGDGELRFVIEDVNSLKRVVARFHFQHPRAISVDDERFQFGVDDSIRLFFSYRYTPELVRTHLEQHGLQVLDQWVTQSEEEGVFLCQRG